jgi:hypothetical protein
MYHAYKLRTLLRTTLITALVTLAIFTGWYLMQRSNSVESAQAAPGLQVPSYCVPPELKGIEELLSKTTDPKGRELLLAKKKSAENAARECAAEAAIHPPATAVPTWLLESLKPTIPAETPIPDPTLQLGIQRGDVMGFGIFIPVMDDNNMWIGFVNDQTVAIVAGYIRMEDGWQQDHPEWQDHPELHVQGALSVTVNYGAPNGIPHRYPTPSRNGAVHFIAACGNTLVLQAADGTIFTFDVTTLSYVDNSAACATPTP